MLSAAEDIITQQEHGHKSSTETHCEEKLTSRHCLVITTGAVLLADILPTLLIKLTFPFFMQRIPFGIRNLVVCLLQATSYLIVAFSKSISMSMTGVVLASISAGLGEITFLSLTPYFGQETISTWSSGTGGAGVIGAMFYAVLTEPYMAGLTPRTSLLIMMIVPVIFAATFWGLLIVPKSVHQVNVMKPNTWIVPISPVKSSQIINDSVQPNNAGFALSENIPIPTSEKVKQRKLNFKEKLLVILPLLKYMIPLMMVYFAEYLINQGIVQLILFECTRGWYLSRGSQYRWYQVLYQVGVFISRSSVGIIKLPYWALIILPIFQMSNVVLFFFEAKYFFIPHIWIVFLLILFEGLFGGAGYVNTFIHIHDYAKPDVREFSMSISSLGDSIGIVAAGLVAIPLHNYVCSTRLPRTSRA